MILNWISAKLFGREEQAMRQWEFDIIDIGSGRLVGTIVARRQTYIDARLAAIDDIGSSTMFLLSPGLEVPLDYSLADVIGQRGHP